MTDAELFKDQLLCFCSVLLHCVWFFNTVLISRKYQINDIFSEILSINTGRNCQSFSLSMVLSIDKICYVQAQEVCVTNHTQTTDTKSTLRWHSKGRVKNWIKRTFKAFLYCLIHTSKVISNIFLGICKTPVSPSSPEIHIQGLAVNMEPPSFLLGTINIWYGITANTRKNNTSEVGKW